MYPPKKNELPHVQHQQAISIYFFLEGLGFIEIVKGLGAKVLTESFDRNVLDGFFFGITFCIWGWVLGREVR